MNARRVVRRLAKGAGIAFIAGTLGGAALLAAEALAARSRSYAKPDLGLAIRASLGSGDKPALRLMLLGDATALGVGVDAVRGDGRRPARPDACRRGRECRAVHGRGRGGAQRRPGHPGGPRAARPAAGPGGDPRRRQRRHSPGPPRRGRGSARHSRTPTARRRHRGRRRYVPRSGMPSVRWPSRCGRSSVGTADGLPAPRPAPPERPEPP